MAGAASTQIRGTGTACQLAMLHREDLPGRPEGRPPFHPERTGGGLHSILNATLVAHSIQSCDPDPGHHQRVGVLVSGPPNIPERLGGLICRVTEPSCAGGRLIGFSFMISVSVLGTPVESLAVGCIPDPVESYKPVEEDGGSPGNQQQS